jgi:hypothetical protein
MTNDVDDPMAAEFGTVAEWTARVAADLGPEFFIPAACRRRWTGCWPGWRPSLVS